MMIMAIQSTDNMDLCNDNELWKDIDIRVIDQRIGAGIGGLDTVVRLYHKPSGIIVEVPRISSSQHYDRAIAFQMIEAALTHPKYREVKC